MKKIGIKFLQDIKYEQFESFQYLLDHDMDYFDIEEYIQEEKIIELDIDDEDKEEREEDLEVLQSLLADFDNDGVKYELYSFEENWEKRGLDCLI